MSKTVCALEERSHRDCEASPRGESHGGTCAGRRDSNLNPRTVPRDSRLSSDVKWALGRGLPGGTAFRWLHSNVRGEGTPWAGCSREGKASWAPLDNGLTMSAAFSPAVSPVGWGKRNREHKGAGRDRVRPTRAKGSCRVREDPRAKRGVPV